jgi:uncharacterized membrane protein YgcG
MLYELTFIYFVCCIFVVSLFVNKFAQIILAAIILAILAILWLLAARCVLHGCYWVASQPIVFGYHVWSREKEKQLLEATREGERSKALGGTGSSEGKSGGSRKKTKKTVRWRDHSTLGEGE